MKATLLILAIVAGTLAYAGWLAFRFMVKPPRWWDDGN